MREIELKLRYDETEKKKIIDYCKGNQYSLKGIMEQVDIYLSPEGINLFARDEAFRVRSEKNEDKETWIVTFKGSNSNPIFHDRTELETKVEDGTRFLEILEAVGFQKLLTITKRRESYVSGAKTICLDYVQGLGSFIEIEIIVDSDGSETESEAHNEIDKIVEQLELKTAVIEDQNYLQLFANKERS